MTKQEAQVILLRAFIATGELPDELAGVLTQLLNLNVAIQIKLNPKG